MAVIKLRKWENTDGSVGKAYQIRYVNHLGKDAKKSGFKTKREAQDALAEITCAINSGTYTNVDKAITFKAASEQYINVYASQNCKAGTVKDYKGYLNNHILPEFGSWKLIDIKQMHIMEFMKKLRNKELAPQTINHIVNLMKVIYKKMIENEVVIKNPLEFIKLLKIPRKEMKALSLKEVKAVLDTAKKHYPDFYPMVFTALYTGMRQGEQLALTWDDINWVACKININKSYGRQIVSTPKTETSIREIEMSDELISILREWKLRCPHSDKNLVFPNKEGNYFDVSNLVKRNFVPLLRKAKVSRVRWHDLRHTYASIMLSQNIPMKYVSNQMGHSSIKITMDRYSHILPETIDNYRNVMDGIFVIETNETNLLQNVLK